MISSPWIRLLLRQYPASYRARYEHEIRELIALERAERGGSIGFWVGTTWDHIWAARRVRRRARGDRAVATILQDLRWAARTLRRAPGFTALAVITLALGVGATSGVFTVLDRVVLRPLPVDAPERSYYLGASLGGRELSVLSDAVLDAFLRSPGPAEQIVAARNGDGIAFDGEQPTRVGTLIVTGGFFEFFRGRPAAGRLLNEADQAPGAPRVTVLSHSFWMERFSGDPAVVGRTLSLGDDVLTIVGVLQADFSAPAPSFWRPDRDLILPMRLGEAPLNDGSFGIRTATRLRGGVTAEAMTEHLNEVGREIYPSLGDPDSFVTGFGVVPLREYVLGTDVTRNLRRLLFAVSLLLMIGCVNVASLLLTRGARRRNELGVRAALGAGRGRVLRQLVVEGAVLGVAGGVLGGLLAWSAVELYRRSTPASIPRLSEVSVDLRTFLFAVVLAVITSITLSLLPALRSIRPAMASLVRGTRSGATRKDNRVRGALVFAETLLAVALVAWSGVLAADLSRLSSDEPGFRREGMLSTRVSLRGRPANADTEQRLVFWRSLLERAEALPGVTHAALATEVPYTSYGIVSATDPEGWDEDQDAWVSFVAVAGDYFEALETELLEGQLPDLDGGDQDRPVAVVNETFVRQYWPDGEAVGRYIGMGPSDPGFDVIGVVRDVPVLPGRAARAQMFVPMRFEPWAAMDLVLATPDMSALAPSVRAMIREVDPRLPIEAQRSFDDIAFDVLSGQRFYASFFGGFAALALLLALVGVYGTTAYATAARSRELGIRMALGARRSQLIARTVRTKTILIGSAAALGSSAALLAAPYLLDDSLRLVDPRAVGPYLAVSVLIVGVGVLAAWIPAVRFSDIDPAHTLREES